MAWGQPRTGLTLFVCLSPQDFVCLVSDGSPHPPSGQVQIPADDRELQARDTPLGLFGPKSLALLSGLHPPWLRGVESSKTVGL